MHRRSICMHSFPFFFLFRFPSRLVLCSRASCHVEAPSRCEFTARPEPAAYGGCIQSRCECFVDADVCKSCPFFGVWPGREIAMSPHTATAEMRAHETRQCTRGRGECAVHHGEICHLASLTHTNYHTLPHPHPHPLALFLSSKHLRTYSTIHLRVC